MSSLQDEVTAFVEPSTTEIVRNASYAKIKENVSRSDRDLLAVVELLGPPLLSDDPRLRRLATGLISRLLRDPSAKIGPSTAPFLTAFLCGRLQHDPPCAAESLSGLWGLFRNGGAAVTSATGADSGGDANGGDGDGPGGGEKEAVTPFPMDTTGSNDGFEAVVSVMCLDQGVAVQAMPVAARTWALALLLRLVEICAEGAGHGSVAEADGVPADLGADEDAGPASRYGMDLSFTVLRSVDGEKDPRCLSVAFPLVSLTLETFREARIRFAEEFFEVTACYFPIAFSPPPGGFPAGSSMPPVVPQRITKEGLRDSLEAALTSHPKLAEHVYPFLAEKLASSVELAKIDALSAFRASCTGFGAHVVARHARLVLWPALRDEVLHGTHGSARAAALVTIARVVGCIDAESPAAAGAGAAPQYGPPGTLLAHFVEPAVAHCAHVLRNPGSQNGQRCAAICAAIAAAGGRPALSVTSKCMASLIRSANGGGGGGGGGGGDGGTSGGAGTAASGDSLPLPDDVAPPSYVGARLASVESIAAIVSASIEGHVTRPSAEAHPLAAHLSDLIPALAGAVTGAGTAAGVSASVPQGDDAGAAAASAASSTSSSAACAASAALALAQLASADGVVARKEAAEIAEHLSRATAELVAVLDRASDAGIDDAPAPSVVSGGSWAQGGDGDDSGDGSGRSASPHITIARSLGRVLRARFGDADGDADVLDKCLPGILGPLAARPSSGAASGAAPASVGPSSLSAVATLALSASEVVHARCLAAIADTVLATWASGRVGCAAVRCLVDAIPTVTRANGFAEFPFHDPAKESDPVPRLTEPELARAVVSIAKGIASVLTLWRADGGATASALRAMEDALTFIRRGVAVCGEPMQRALAASACEWAGIACTARAGSDAAPAPAAQAPSFADDSGGRPGDRIAVACAVLTPLRPPIAAAIEPTPGDSVSSVVSVAVAAVGSPGACEPPLQAQIHRYLANQCCKAARDGNERFASSALDALDAARSTVAGENVSLAAGWVCKGLVSGGPRARDLPSQERARALLRAILDAGYFSGFGAVTSAAADETSLGPGTHARAPSIAKQAFYANESELLLGGDSPAKAGSLAPAVLGAITSMLAGLPKDVVGSDMPRLLPVLVCALSAYGETGGKDPRATAESSAAGRDTDAEAIAAELKRCDAALTVVLGAAREDPAVLESYADELVFALCALSSARGSVRVRVMSIECLHSFASLRPHTIVPHKSAILRALKGARGDKKRLVRRAAAECTNRFAQM